MCSCGEFLARSGKLRGLSWVKGGRLAGSSLPLAGHWHEGEDGVGRQAQGGMESKQSVHASMDFGSIRVNSGGKALRCGGDLCLGADGGCPCCPAVGDHGVWWR